jgi:hypothetical protein
MPTENTTLKRVHEFTGAWRWPEDVERFIRDECNGKCLHVCCGKSDLGDVTLDADAGNSPDIAGDMTELPFRDCEFDTVIADPPWKSVDIFDRHGMFYELVRVTKRQGKIIHNATWVPESEQCEKLAEYRRQDISFGDASIISIFERWKDQTSLEKYQ